MHGISRMLAHLNLLFLHRKLSRKNNIKYLEITLGKKPLEHYAQQLLQFSTSKSFIQTHIHCKFIVALMKDYLDFAKTFYNK